MPPPIDLLRRDSTQRAAILDAPERPLDMMMFWGNEAFLLDDTKLEMEYIDTEAIGAADRRKMQNFRADSFRDVEGDGATSTPAHVIQIHNVTASDILEMQQVDVTWTRNGDQQDAVYQAAQRAQRGGGALAVPGRSPSGDDRGGAGYGSVEEELAASMGAYDSNGSRKRKVKKKLPPIQHSTEWAY